MTAEQKSFIRSGFESLIDFVYPQLCLICAGENVVSDNLVCENCWSKATGDAHALCLSCRIPLGEFLKCEQCRGQMAIPVIVLGHFQYPLQEIIHQFKYQGYHQLGTALANRLMDKHLSTIEKIRPTLSVPVPLDSIRKRLRGFNQAAVLSDILSKRLEISTAGDLLMKSRKTKDQTKLDFGKRAENLKGAFTVEGHIKQEERIIIIDDVITTGATLREGVRAVTEAGGKVVMAAAIAIADK